MREVEAMCDRVLFLSRGRIVAQGSPREVLDRARRETLEDVFIDIARGGLLRDPSEPDVVG
jgi:ABC-2 type transport system ATP-binding protein